MFSMTRNEKYLYKIAISQSEVYVPPLHPQSCSENEAWGKTAGKSSSVLEFELECSREK